VEKRVIENENSNQKLLIDNLKVTLRGKETQMKELEIKLTVTRK
jgi:hypothetical protein